jgi:hypothetical protein
MARSYASTMTTSLVEGVTHRFIETNGIRMRVAETSAALPDFFPRF